jgi:O-antigen ligase
LHGLRLFGARALPIVTAIVCLLLLVAAGLFAGGCPARLLVELAIVTALVVIGTRQVVMHYASQPVQIERGSVLPALAIIVTSLVLTAGAVAELPVPVVTHRTANLIHLGLAYRLLHYLVSGYVTAALYRLRRSRAESQAIRGISMAEAGLAAILVFATLNGTFFKISQSARDCLLLGLTLLIGLLSWCNTLREQPGSTDRRRRWLMLALAGFWLAVTLATIGSHSFEASLKQWYHLSLWLLVLLVMAAAVRRLVEAERLLAVMLAAAVVAAVAGLAATVLTANQVGWGSALQVRLRMGYMHANGSGIFAVTMIILGAAMWPRWRSWWQRWSLGFGIGLLLVATVLTYSRSAAIGLLCGLVMLALLHFYRPQPVTNPGRGGRRRIVLVLLTGLALLVPAILLGISLTMRTTTGTLASRLVLWKVAAQATRDQPLLGIGPAGGLPTAYCDVLSHSEIVLIRPLTDTHTHNLVLEIVQGTGLLGLVTAGWLLVAALWFFRQTLAACRESDARPLLVATGAGLAALLPPHLLSLSLSATSLVPARALILLGLVLAISRICRPVATADATAEPAPGAGSALLPLLICLATAILVLVPARFEQLGRHAIDSWQAGDTEQARDRLQAMARLYWFHAWPHASQARLADNLAESAAALEQAIRRRPGHAPSYRWLGWLYWRQNRPLQALQAIEQAVRLDPYWLSGESLKGKPYQLDLALISAALGRREQALIAFRDAVLIAPGCLDRGDWFNHARGIALDPVYTSYSAARGIGPRLADRISYHLDPDEENPEPSVRAGEPEIFLRDLVTVIAAPGAAIPPDQLELVRDQWASLAETALAWGHTELFEHCQASAEAMSGPGSAIMADHLARRARADLLLNRLQQAEASLHAAREISDLPAVHYLLAHVYKSQGKKKKHLQELQIMASFWDPSVICRPQCAQLQNELAQALAAAGQPRSALAAFKVQQYLTLTDERALAVQVDIGRMLHRLGRWQEEIDAYVFAVKHSARMDPDDQLPEAMLRRMARRTVNAYLELGVAREQVMVLQRRALGSATRSNAGVRPTPTPLSESYLAILQAELTSYRKRGGAG